MANNNICGDCHHYTDVGKCRISGHSKREYCAFFAEACPLFTKEPTEKEMTKENKPLVTVTEPEKTCKDCGRTLPLDAFGSNKNGKLNVCRECISKRRKRANAERKKPQTPAKPETAPKPETQRYAVTRKALTEAEAAEAKHNAILTALTVATDQELAEELGRRGYKGTLHKDLNFAE